MQPYRCLYVCLMRFFCGVEHAEVYSFPVQRNSCLVSTNALVLRNAGYSKAVRFSAYVPEILAMRSKTQILYSVIRPVLVDVVYVHAVRD